MDRISHTGPIYRRWEQAEAVPGYAPGCEALRVGQCERSGRNLLQTNHSSIGVSMDHAQL
jgi:hypothetical protein